MRTGAAILAAMVGSLALHGIGLVLAPEVAVPHAPAGGGPAPLAIGRGFADLAEGRLTPVAPDRAAGAAAVTASDGATPVPPLATATPVTASTSAAPAVPPQARPVAASPPVMAPVMAPVTTPSPRVAPAPAVTAAAPAVTAAAPARVAAAPPVETLVAADLVTAVLRAPRPPARPAAVGPGPAPPAPARPQAAAPQGNAATDQRSGSDTAGPTVPADPSGGPAADPAPATPATVADIANYPGQVMQHLSRVRRERLDRAGDVEVVFAIAANGALASVAILRGSGSDEIDRAAVSYVTRAAPFPPPPAGAQTRFQILLTMD